MLNYFRILKKSEYSKKLKPPKNSLKQSSGRLHFDLKWNGMANGQIVHEGPSYICVYV